MKGVLRCTYVCGSRAVSEGLKKVKETATVLMLRDDDKG